MAKRGDSKLLTVTEAAEQMRVSRRTVQRYIALGRLPVIKLSPRKMFVDQADIDKLFKKERKATK